jgi:hypothetical protein
MGAEGHEVHSAIRCAAWQGFCLFVSQNKNWSFARHSADRPMHKFVGDRIADDRDLLIRKTPDDVD